MMLFRNGIEHEYEITSYISYVCDIIRKNDISIKSHDTSSSVLLSMCDEVGDHNVEYTMRSNAH
jgi:hypothetical protein